MDVRILGPAEVRHDGSPVALRGAKARQLLVLLAVRANRPVPADVLVEELWESSPPPSASTALRVHVGHLRQVLEPDRDQNTASARLPAGPQGYVLTLEPNELDIERFERLVLAARQANGSGTAGAAVPLLTEALDLWRGEALADVCGLSAGRMERERLGELRAVAFEELAEARLALGEHALLVDVLATAIELFPLREELTARHMLALYRSNRPQDALRSYALLGRRLDELGLVPSETLRRLEEDILLERSSLDYHRPLRSDAPTHLHGPSTRMIGRRDELRAVAGLLDAPTGERPRMGVITGPDGIGKTVLTNELCSRAGRAGVRCLVGTCHATPGVAYEPLQQILGEPVVTTPPAGFPGGASLVARTRFELFESVAARLAARCPDTSVVVVEDLHKADRSTLVMLRHLLRHRALADVCFICTYRDDLGAYARSTLIDELVSSSHGVVEHLPPLQEAEVRSLVRETAPPEIVEFLAEHAAVLRRVTAGSPLHLRELLRALDEYPIPAEQLSSEVPATVARIAAGGLAELVGRRLDQLSPAGRELISTAAVLRGTISTDLLAEIGGRPAETTLTVLEECLATRLLVEDRVRPDSFSFPHDLVRDAVVEKEPPGRRGLLHLRVARVLARRPQVAPALVASHFLEALVLGGEHLDEAQSGECRRQAAGFSELAAVDAERQFMFAEASEWEQWCRALASGSLLSG